MWASRSFCSSSTMRDARTVFPESLRVSNRNLIQLNMNFKRSISLPAPGIPLIHSNDVELKSGSNQPCIQLFWRSQRPLPGLCSRVVTPLSWSTSVLAADNQFRTVMRRCLCSSSLRLWRSASAAARPFSICWNNCSNSTRFAWLSTRRPCRWRFAKSPENSVRNVFQVAWKSCRQAATELVRTLSFSPKQTYFFGGNT